MHKRIHGKRPQLIGIAGGSCAGKTWLADHLSQLLGSKVARLSLDDFYQDRSHLSLERRARFNFDHPRAIDWGRLESVLQQCVNAERVRIPRYDFATHARRSEEVTLEPEAVIIVEGLWLFRRKAVRDLFSLKIFIRSSEDLCVSRRLERDTRERGRTREQVLDQLKRQTLPMFSRFVAPQEKYADVVLQAPVTAEEISNLMNRIERNLHPFGI